MNCDEKEVERSIYFPKHILDSLFITNFGKAQILLILGVEIFSFMWYTKIVLL